ncbi:hypothetical protein PENTCL1PPCAC_19984, partial [Pristionchus entomophagus]
VPGTGVDHTNFMSDFDDDDCDFDDDYYNDMEDDIADDETEKKNVEDAENAEAECLETVQIEQVLNEAVAALVESIHVTPTLARALLNGHSWDVDKVRLLMSSPSTLDDAMVACGMQLKTNDGAKKPKLSTRSLESEASTSSSTECAVCIRSDVEMRWLACEHSFCLTCWRTHIEMRLSSGVSTRIECMHSDCTLVCSAEFALAALNKAAFRAKYEKFVFRDYVTAHPELRFCPGRDCTLIIRSREQKPRRITCDKCSATFCAMCSGAYHAPTSCEMIKKWMVKCEDDSESANYISAHTKDCPQCHSCIEKNGGCNHMQCLKCKHHFCWMCFGDWKTHGSEYYECSRYRENPEVATEANHMKARRALEKYLHYYERYENHAKSLRMEVQMRDKLKQRIEEKVTGHDGTWIDWQHLHEASMLLAKCRYTLQYTYPFAYYLERCARKELFEYQQAQLEKEVEDLAWAVERADAGSRGVLEAHMHRAEHKRATLLHDFFLADDDANSFAALPGQLRPDEDAPSTSTSPKDSVLKATSKAVSKEKTASSKGKVSS